MTNRWEFAGWYYNRAGQSIGPVSTEAVVASLKSNELQREDEVLVAWNVAGKSRVFRSRAIAALDFDSIEL